MTAVIENETVNAETQADEPEEVIDYSAFTAAYAGVTVEQVEDDDSDTVKSLREVYNTLGPKSKRAVKRLLKDEAEKCVMERNDFAEAKRLMLINNNAAKSTSVASGNATRSRKTPEEKALETFKVLHYAYQLVFTRLQDAGINVTENTPEATDLSGAQAYASWLENGQEGDEPELDNDLKRAARVSIGRGPAGQGRKPGKTKAEDTEAEVADAE